MKKLSIVFFPVLFLILILSFKNGPAKRNHDKTGSPLSDGKCTDCHSAGSFGVSLDIKMFDGDEQVNKYVPGHKYKFKYRIKHVGNPKKYGFQTTFLDSTNLFAGLFEDVPNGFQISELNNVKYIEHSSPGDNEFLNFEWMSPDSSVGDITVYFGGIAANGNGSTSGDGGAVRTFVIEEQTTGTDDMELSRKDDFEFNFDYENNILVINLLTDVNLTGRIISINGTVVKSFEISNKSREIIDLNHLKTGVYIVQAAAKNKKRSMKFFKL